jgi:histidyl-tRNA synthetase
MKAQEVKLAPRNHRKIFVVYVGDLAKRKALKLVEDLRVAGFSVSEAFGKESLKTQLKIADKEGFPLALILGQKEIYEESVIIRDLRSSLQETIPLSKIVEEVKKRLREKIQE